MRSSYGIISKDMDKYVTVGYIFDPGKRYSPIRCVVVRTYGQEQYTTSTHSFELETQDTVHEK